MDVSGWILSIIKEWDISVSCLMRGVGFSRIDTSVTFGSPQTNCSSYTINTISTTKSTEQLGVE
jgi:hypothetical protein